MNRIQNISSNAKQYQRFYLSDNSTVDMTLEYKPLQLGWFITSLTHNDFTIENIRVCVTPNLLHQFINKLPFGLMITTKNNQEPLSQSDFSSGFAEMYFLSKDECVSYLEYTRAEV